MVQQIATSSHELRHALRHAIAEKLKLGDGIGASAAQEIEPVGIREFIMGARYLDRSYFWEEPLEELEALKAPGILGGVIEQGIGAGKTYKISTIPLYDIYRIHHMRKYQGVELDQRYELDPKDTRIYVAIFTLNGTLAKELFEYMKGFAQKSPWFQKHLPINPRVASELQFCDPDTGEVLYVAYPGHSKQSSAIGRNLLSCILDEANFFTKAESSGSSGTDYAKELHDSLERRIRSRFGLDGSVLVISSRNTVRDFTSMRRIELQKDPDLAKYYYLPPVRASWHYWPKTRKEKEQWRLFDTSRLNWADDKKLPWKDIEHADGLYVPERLWEAFTSNPEGAMRDYASTPSEAQEPFFRLRDRIRPDFEITNPILPEVKPTDWMNPAKSFDSLVADWFWGDAEVVYHFHVDLAEKWDKCGIAIAHCSGVVEAAAQEGEDRAEKVPLIDVVAMICVGAPKGGEILFERIREILYWLRKDRGFRLRGKSSFDGFQSTDSLQILTRKGFTVEKLSLDRTTEHYETLKCAINDGRLFFPPAHGQKVGDGYSIICEMAQKGDPSAIFQKELFELETFSGRKVNHPPYGSKDIADAVCGAVAQVTRGMRKPPERWEDAV